MAFIRQYGMAGDPGPRNVPKRKTAGSGPKVKAQRKRNVRQQRAARGTQGAAKGPGKKKKGMSLPKIDTAALSSLVKKHGAAAIDMLRQGNLLGAAGSAIFGGGGEEPLALPGKMPSLGAFKMPRGLGGKGRRTRNPANVKALRRALGRVEGFGRLVKRVNKMLPTAHRFQVHGVLKHKRRRKSA